ncbi:UNVERIFIED_CONTAM: hypothetical protein PYX00_000566 [Menopon gallinae]|uniref:MARVEL domain-containing protein n=1 Tax=Menopon gallinae TaxID=328185 RepID=A0AAW2I9Q2_9NEOP
MDRFDILSLIVKILKFILTLIILVLYRAGDHGEFLGVGGTFELYEDKTVDVEILASGVIVGYMLYNLSVMISYAVAKERLANVIQDCLMNIIGIFLWMGVAGSALHYWHSAKDEWRTREIGSERDAGLAMGSFCVFNGLLHIVDAALSLKLFLDSDEVKYRTSSARRV